MDILYLLIPLSLILIFAIGAVFWWALQHRQFDDLEQQGALILQDDGEAVGAHGQESGNDTKVI